MHTDRIVPQQWMLVSREIREHLAVIFHLGRSGITEVHNEQVVTDGRTNEDLSSITAASMAEYTGYGADYFEKPHPEDQIAPSFGRLWELSVAKAHSELNPPVGAIIGPAQVLGATPAGLPTIVSGNTPVVETSEERAARIKAMRVANMAKGRAAAAAKRAATK